MALAALAAFAGSPSPVAAAEPPACNLVPLEEQYENADAAFVGRLVSDRPGSAAGRVYRFAVDRVLKGPIGSQVDVSAPLLTDRDGTPLVRGVAVGVLADLDGARLTTTSCGLIDPGSLVSASEPQRGQRIKLAIGLVLAGLAVGFALLRLRRKPVRGRNVGEPPAAAPRNGR
jgi:hypothetical protein